MNKQEFVDNLAERCEFSKAEAGRAVDAILDSLTDAMVNGDEVSFTGFGKFVSQHRGARQGVNPQNPSQKIRISAANVPKFKPGTWLREAASQAPSADVPATASNRPGAAASGDAAAEAASSREPAPSTGSDRPEWRPLGGRS